MFRKVFFNSNKYLNRINILNSHIKKNIYFKRNFIQGQISNQHNNFPEQIPLKSILAFSLMGFLGGNEKELSPEEEIVLTMKRAILCTQREQYNQAEQLLHIALNMAQKQNNQDAITYVYDLMANLAMERNEPTKAKNLFVQVMQRLLQNGVEESDLKVIHISLKVANVHVQMGYLKEAEIGYKWCIDKLKTKTDDESLILRGITLDYYAQLLLNRNQLNEAIDCMKSAHEICVQVLGVSSSQSVKLLNDLGSACWRAGDLYAAETYFKKSLNLIKSSGDETYVGVLKYNLGMLLMEKGLYKESEQLCKEAWAFGKSNNDNDVLNRANECLNELNNRKRAKV